MADVATDGGAVSLPPDYAWLKNSEQHPLPSAEYLGPAEPDETLQITIVLRRRADGPAVPGFDHFTLRRRKRPSRDAVAAQYGAAPDDIAAITDFVGKAGLRLVEIHAGRKTVVVSGTVAQMEAAFAVKLGRYRYERKNRGKDSTHETYRGRDGLVALPTALAKIVIAILGLDNLRVLKRASADPPVTTPLTVAQIAACYNFPTNSAVGQTIAIFAGETYDPSDVNQFFNNNPPQIIPVSVDGTVNPGLPDIETTQDICVAASAAPGAAIGLYMFVGSSLSGFFDAIVRVLFPNAGDPDCYVISTSYYPALGDDLPTLLKQGITAGFVDAVHQALQDAALLGVTFCVCSGDQGTDTTSYGGGTSDGLAHVTYPASDPWALGCGGTTVGTNSGTIGPQNFVEYVWNDNSGATGGGVSAFFPVPSYQNNVTIPNSLNGGQQGRGVPDIAGNAATQSAYRIYSGGMQVIGGGTSVAAPLYAGLIAVINAALPEPVGFINPMLYALGNAVCRDVNPFATNPPSGPLDNHLNTVSGYTAGPGWDACTGWGSINGQALLTALQSAMQRDCYLVLDWSSFAKAGIAEMQAVSMTNTADFPNAFYVVVDGFTPADLGIGTPQPVVPSLSFGPAQPAGLTYKFGPAVAAGMPATPNAPQRFTFACDFTFANTNGFPVAAQQNDQIELNVTVTPATSNPPVSAGAVIELTSQSAPFMVAGATSWLSDDIRVFQIQPNQSPPGLPSVVLQYDGAPLDIPIFANYFIQQVVTNYNQLAATQLPPDHPFDMLQTGEQASFLDTLQFTGTTTPVLNFAVARVRYQDDATDAEGVRLFFRSFPALALSTAYDQTSTYRRFSDNIEFGHTIPLLGSQFSAQANMQLETIPFFAQARVDATQVSMQTQDDVTNFQTIPHDAGGNTTYAYYGCWLDTNQPTQLYPATPNGDGPFSPPLETIADLFDGQHQCITAEVAFDPIAIPQGATPGANTMLGQRNLALLPMANPGQPASRRVSHPFEIRSQPKAAGQDDVQSDLPDELMFVWGNVPKGSTATLYLPAIAAAQLKALAAATSGFHQVTVLDAHTVSWPAAGITYLPLPRLANANVVGLLSLELPLGIKKGEVYNVLVRQLTGVDEAVKTPDIRKSQLSLLRWRRVLGTFQINIPIRLKEQMLPAEERLLSVLRAMQQAKTRQSKWFVVFNRYVEEIAARVAALGGKPDLIKPSPYGEWQTGATKPAGGGLATQGEYSGKIAGIKFDRFGDFSGFILETENGELRTFHGREAKVEAVVRDAWKERTTVVIGVDPGAPDWPASIVLQRS